MAPVPAGADRVHDLDWCTHVTTYDAIGTGYATTRRPDPRLAARLHAALAGSESVVNVGAGAGSYEPTSTVLAVEPSGVMIAQRPPGSAPVVRAVAEQLPLRRSAVDAAMAVLTVHHWHDVESGLAELTRVARRRVVILTWDPAVTSQFWLFADYLPEAAAFDQAHSVPLAVLTASLPGARVEPLPIPADCTDGFAAAFWRRPQMYLQPDVRAGISVLARLGEAALTEGLAALARDLETGAWAARHRHLLALPELDVGYRLVVADV